MYCKTCLQVNPLPRCVEPGGEIILTGITFPNDVNTNLYAILWDHSTNRNSIFNITVDGLGEIIETNGVASTGLNLTDAYNLMGHKYELEFTNLNMAPVTATIDGTDTCCVKFTTLKPLVGDGEVELTTGQCDA